MIKLQEPEKEIKEKVPRWKRCTIYTGPLFTRDGVEDEEKLSKRLDLGDKGVSVCLYVRLEREAV